MTVSDLKRALVENSIDEGSYLILPPRLTEGPLILTRTEDGRWRVVLNDRGEFVLDETFDSENDAARFFLKKNLLSIVSRKDLRQSKIPSTFAEFYESQRALLAKYGLDDE